jgi:hypothetical protein
MFRRPDSKQFSDGHHLMLTAGHCDTGLGDGVERSDRSGDPGPEVGVIDHSRLCDNCIDSATIRVDSTGASYAYDVWGDNDTQTSYPEDGTAFPQPFDKVTRDSAFTGEIRGITVEDVNQSVTSSDNITRIDQTFVHSSLTIVRAGDSGGPWMQHEGTTNKVRMVGTTTCGQGEFGYYQQMGRIDSARGVTVPSQ